MRTATRGVVAVLATLTLAGCGGSSAKTVQPLSPAATSATVTAAAGSSAAVTTSAAATPAASATSPAATTAPSPSIPSSAPSPATTTTSHPGKVLPSYEKDPGVTVLRAWARQAGRTVNAGHYVDAKLRALMTPQLTARIQAILGGEVGHLYLGPLPLTPISLTVTSAVSRNIPICVVDDGFSVNPKTHKPYGPREVIPILSKAYFLDGHWLVSAFDSATFSCAGVNIPEPKW